MGETTILSYPGPDRSVKLEALRKGRANPRRYRNRRIGEFLKELKMTEGRGTGISKIKHAMQDNGSPEAEFEFDEDHRYFQVRLPVHEAVKEKEEKRALAGGAQSGVESGVESDMTHAILRLLRFSPLAKSEIAQKLGKDKPTRYLNDLMRKLIEIRKVEYTIPDKPNSRLQKYRLTEKEKLLLAKKD
ncbi:ATP-binding protein [Desulfoplanes sp. PS50]